MSDISYSTYAFRDRELAPALDAIAAAGFNCVELSMDSHASGPPTGQALARVQSDLSQRRMRATTVHAPMTTNVLGAPEEIWRKEKVGVLGDCLRFTGDLGAAGMVIHGIPNPRFVPTDRELAAYLEPMKQAMQRSTEELVPVAAKAGVRMLLENLPYDKDLAFAYPLITMRELRPFVDTFPADQVGLVFDTGHAWTGGLDPATEIEVAGDRLWGTHLQDVDHDNPNDDHWMPTAGDLDWDAIRAALKRVNYTGTWTFEVINGREGESHEQLARKTRDVASQWDL